MSLWCSARCGPQIGRNMAKNTVIPQPYYRVTSLTQTHPLSTIAICSQSQSQFPNFSYHRTINTVTTNNSIVSQRSYYHCVSNNPTMRNGKNNPQSLLFNGSQRNFAVYHPKRLLFPKYKKKYMQPEKKKEYMFSEDTLHSLSHGQDWVVKIKVTDYDKKRLYRAHPRRYVLRLWSDILEQYLWLPVSELALHRIHQAGSLDRYILTSEKKKLQSRLGERLRHRLMRQLERREDEMIERALNGDKKALPIAYTIVTEREKWERLALKRRNHWLRANEGRVECERSQWVRDQLNERIMAIKEGTLAQVPQKEEPLWKQLQPFFNDIKKLSVPPVEPPVEQTK